MVAETVPSVCQSIEKMLESLVLDDKGNANAAIAWALASKLDECRDSSQVGHATAIAPIAKELREVVEVILESTESTAEFVADLLSEVDDSADSRT